MGARLKFIVLFLGVCFAENILGYEEKSTYQKQVRIETKILPVKHNKVPCDFNPYFLYFVENCDFETAHGFMMLPAREDCSLIYMFHGGKSNYKSTNACT